MQAGAGKREPDRSFRNGGAAFFIPLTGSGNVADRDLSLPQEVHSAHNGLKTNAVVVLFSEPIDERIRVRTSLYFWRMASAETPRCACRMRQK